MTPGGLLQKGDKIRHKDSDSLFEVVKREGNDAMYSVILKPADDKPLPLSARQAYGYPGCFRLLEVGYWLGRTYKYEGK